jgi:hypothetical protein
MNPLVKSVLTFKGVKGGRGAKGFEVVRVTGTTGNGDGRTGNRTKGKRDEGQQGNPIKSRKKSGATI